MQSENYSRPLQILQSKFTCPTLKSIIQNHLTSIDYFTSQKQAIKKKFQNQITQPQNTKPNSTTQPIPCNLFKNLIKKIEMEVPKFQLQISQQKLFIKELQQEIQGLKKQMQIQKELKELQKGEEKPTNRVQKRKKVSKVQAIHKQIKAEMGKWKKKYRQKLTQNRLHRFNAHQQNMKHLNQMQQKQKQLKKLKDQVSQEVQKTKQKQTQINDYRQKQQIMTLEIHKQTKKIFQMKFNQKKNLQKLKTISNGKTKLISKLQNAITFINRRYKTNYLYEKGLIQIIKQNIKEANDSKPESERQSLNEIEKIVSSKLLERLQQNMTKECHQKWQEPLRTDKIQLIQPILNTVKNFIHEKNMIFFRQNKLILSTKIDNQEEIDACEVGFQLNRIPYDDKIGLEDLKKLDQAGVLKIKDNNVDHKRWRFLVDNFEELFMDLKWVSLKNLQFDEIKLDDLQKLSSLESVHLTIDHNSVLKNQLNQLIRVNKNLKKFVRIS